MSIYNSLSLEVRVGLLIVGAIILFFSMIPLISYKQPARYKSGQGCLAFCNQNGLVVREWSYGNNCSCVSPNASENIGQ